MVDRIEIMGHEFDVNTLLYEPIKVMDIIEGLLRPHNKLHIQRWHDDDNRKLVEFTIDTSEFSGDTMRFRYINNEIIDIVSHESYSRRHNFLYFISNNDKIGLDDELNIAKMMNSKTDIGDFCINIESLKYKHIRIRFIDSKYEGMKYLTTEINFEECA